MQYEMHHCVVQLEFTSNIYKEQKILTLSGLNYTSIMCSNIIN